MLQIEPQTPLSNDERGFTMQLFGEHTTHNYLFALRKAGYESGNHYHTGSNPRKNPEILFVVSGEMLLTTISPAGKKQENLIKSVSKVTIPAGYWHHLKSVSDCLFFELNSLQDHIDDTVKCTADEFLKNHVQQQ